MTFISTDEPFPNFLSITSRTISCGFSPDPFEKLRRIEINCLPRGIPVPMNDNVFKFVVDRAPRTIVFPSEGSQCRRILQSCPGWAYMLQPRVSAGRIRLQFPCQMIGTLFWESEDGGELFDVDVHAV